MESRRTPLFASHRERGARFTDFGGWEMPVSFASIREEHAAVRTSVGIFDVSHMGEIEVHGPDAETLCQRMTTNNVSVLTPGRAQYSTITNEAGVIIDDIMLYRLDTDRFLFIPNAGTDAAMTERWEARITDWDLDATVENRTESFGMLAVQGPNAVDTLTDAGISAPDSIPTMGIEEREMGWCARTGYTGEDGFELIIPWEETPAIDAALRGERCGLGARDTLRLEMGYVLAGNEFHATENPRTPIEAGLDFIVDLDAAPPFVGWEAISEQVETGPPERLIGIQMRERGIPRSGYAITDGDGSTIGSVTSGTMSPTLDTAIGLGYVAVDHATPGETVGVQIRGDERMARIVTPPFLA